MRVNYEILNILYHMEAWSKIVAATQKEIIAALAGEKVIFTEKTIYLHLRELIRLGYVKYGIMKLNAKTYNVSAKGLEWMKEMEKKDF